MPTVLITGITGFLAAHVALNFLEKGWTVRGTLRSESKRAAMNAVPELAPYAKSGKFQLFVTGPLENGDYTEAIKGVDSVVHTASPVEFGDEEFKDSHLAPALQGTVSVLEAAGKEPSVKSVVYTGTYGAIGDHRTHPTQQVGRVITEDDWNPYTIEQMEEIVKTGKNDNETFPAGYLFYKTAKKYAELAAWDTQKKVQKEYGAKWSLASLNCVMIFGPPIQPHTSLSNAGMSTSILWALAQGKDKPIMDTLYPYMVDVRDAAEAHYQAAVRNAQGRFICSGDVYSFQEWADKLREFFPEQKDRFALGTPGKYAYVDPGVYELKNDKSIKELGITYRPKDETIKDTFTKFFEMEKQGLN
ncbi:oxidoreductase [Kwoniella heveanensis CBS 569]|uniref:Oxidoreductase n=1 Tax=Kwoniella heveanensis BCC8398 TaxID=1296120 RepID=A0A1B9H3R4_9TREE|nr:oxidoreductase [Kwoniella heveanensis BCC8398]OCF42695.1 oxidoreductase [Kwoniella heveanensis CBS 569]